MRYLILTLLIIFAVLLTANEVDTLFFLQTTDIHGNILSYDYRYDKVTDHGLDRIATLIDSFRANHKNVILLETGDLFQGTPLSDYYFHHQSEKENPIIEVANYLGYEAMAVGNHEIEYGPAIYDKLEAACNFPWLSANAMINEKESYFQPYKILEIDDIKIGILGLTTPAIPVWLNEDKYPGITWEDMTNSAGKIMLELQPQVDIVIGLFHAGLDWRDGLEQTQKKGTPRENDSAVVGAVIDGFDLILSGHSHVLFPKQKITTKVDTGASYLNSGCHGNYLGVAEIVVEKSDTGIQIIEKSIWNIKTENIEPSSKIKEIMQPYHDELQQFLKKPIASIKGRISTEKAYFQDNKIVELINQAQIDFTGADISFACCFNPKQVIEDRDFLVSDAYTAYPYENTIYLVKLTGKQIKSYLERSAEFYKISDGEVVRSDKISGYNYDMAEGISYKIYPDNPVENRIENILSQGKPLNMEKKYTVAINSFRFNGGGGLLVQTEEIPVEVIRETNEKVRDILIKYLAQKEIVDLNVNNNWEIIR